MEHPQFQGPTKAKLPVLHINFPFPHLLNCVVETWGNWVRFIMFISLWPLLFPVSVSCFEEGQLQQVARSSDTES